CTRGGLEDVARFDVW
nr:immunoglobulin heavy chain junction region [Macaca mulatta]MOW75594.1 immunoglobulin heavy chain junction region [Macaca mulatta]MOW76238.1 immunoglobulin heavy chain junction region [Macaca mulatta]MOW76344.1 immunoglobulin heavy chain junction region [Macaca mulatta]MOW76825.1 immunoglobulin heavy chain junction region [Macaca mulatta]